MPDEQGAAPIVAVLDANVLYPFRVRDALLRFCEAGLYQARWSRNILDEWTSRLLAHKPHLRESVMSQLAAMAEAFPEALVEGYASLVPALTLPDPDDRHVLAAAIHTDANAIVTGNLRDFPARILDAHRLKAATADDFLARLFADDPEVSSSALRTMRTEYRNPAMTRHAFLSDLRRNGLERIATLAEGSLDDV